MLRKLRVFRDAEFKLARFPLIYKKKNEERGGKGMRKRARMLGEP